MHNTRLSAREWLHALWQWLSQASRRPDWQVLASAAWPLLPVAGGLLVPLAAEHTRCTVVLPGADWPVGLQSVLQKLGVSVLDTASFELPADALVSAGYVRSGCGVGLALALKAALSTGQQLDTRSVEELTAAERRLLRTYLLQPIWFQQHTAATGAADSAALAAIVKRLPLFELANDGSWSAPAEGEQQAGDGGAREQQLGIASSDTAIFVPLQEGCALAPQGGESWRCLAPAHR